MTAEVASIKLVGTEYWVYYHDEVVSKQKNIVKATEKLYKLVKGQSNNR